MPNTLVVDDDPHIETLFKSGGGGGTFTFARSDDQALHILEAEHDIDIAVVAIDSAAIGGMGLFKRLRGGRLRIPRIALTSGADLKLIRGAMNEGAVDFLTKPVSDARLFARIASLVRMKRLLDQWRMRKETTKILGSLSEDELEFDNDRESLIVLVDDGTMLGAGIKETLKKDNHAVAIIGGTGDVAGEAAAAGADVIIISLSSEGDVSLRLASKLRSLESTRLIPILLIGGEEDLDLMIKAMELGVNDYLSRPIDEQELLARVRTLVRRKRYQDSLHENFLRNLSLALIDSLTGLHNRRYLAAHLESVMGRAAKTGNPVSLMMIDIDLFKQVNDDHGHAVGDDVLCEVAQRIALNVRGIDMAARYGGDEFVVIMPDTSIKTAMKVAKRLYGFIAGEPFKVSGGGPGGGGESIEITISIGVTESRDGSCAPKDILKRADEALYKAKSQGRNQVVKAP